MVVTTYTPHVWIEYYDTGTNKATYLTTSGTQYSIMQNYVDYTFHDTLYYTKTQCDTNYYFSSSYHTGFVLEYLDGYSGAQLVAMGVATGCIAIWSGAIVDIPTGWAICDGSSGRPDLRDKFIVGAGSTYSVNSTGGNATVASSGTVTVGAYALLTTDIPNHYHTLPHDKHEAFNNTNQGSPGGAPYYLGGDTTSVSHSSTTDAAGTGGTHTHSGSTIKGLGTANNNIPKYYALAYIIKV